MKRTFSLFLAVLFVTLAFAGCQSDDGNTENTTTAVSTTETTTALSTAETTTAPVDPPVTATRIKICDEVNTYYKLVRPEKYTDDMLANLQLIMQAVKDMTDNKVYLLPDEDWYREGTVDISAKTEILLGYTNRDEARQVMGEIGYDDYKITVIGNKIVIAAHNKTRLAEAAKYFAENMLTTETDENGKLSVWYNGETYSYSSGKSYMITSDNPLSGYTVVCNTDNADIKKSAEIFTEEIEKVFGCKLSVVDDNTAETECEIIIGKNSRSLSKSYLADNEIGDTDYLIAVSGKKLFIGSPSDFITRISVTAFCDDYVNSYYTYTLPFEEDFKMTSLAYAFDDSPTRADGTDVRIMSFNLLCELWNDHTPITGRDINAFAIMEYYGVDVIGMQEVSDKWYSALNDLFGSKYAFTDTKNTKGETNFSTLAYNTETLKMLDHGVKVFSEGNSTALRLATWAYFEKISDGKKFIAVSTHWDLGGNLEYQLVHADEMADLVLSLESRFNVPVITTGDYNANESSSPYTNFVNKTGYHEAKYTAAVINRACKTTHNIYVAVSTSAANSIDHIFGSDKAEFLYYNVLVDKITIDTSDHCPIYADVKLK